MKSHRPFTFQLLLAAALVATSPPLCADPLMPKDSAALTPEAKHQLIVSLIQKLKGADIDQRERAAEALGSMGPSAAEAIPALRAALNDDLPNFRIRCVEALANMGQAAIPAFSEALRSSDTDVRSVAAGALAKFGSDAAAAVPALVKALGDNDSTVRSRAGTALERIGSASIDAVAARLEDPDPGFRMRVVRILGALDTPAPVISKLILRLADEDSQVRLGAMKALTRKGTACVPPLMEALASPSAPLRARAAETLGDLARDADAAVPSLITALQDHESSVRVAAARALGKIGPGALPALAALRELAKDSDPTIAASATDAISDLTSTHTEEVVTAGAPASPTPAPAVPVTHRAVKKAGPRSSAAAAPKGSPVSRLIKQLGSADEAARTASEASLTTLGASAVPALIKGLSNPNVAIRVGCERVLGALGPLAKPAAPALSEMMRNPLPESRDAAFHAMVAIDSAAAVAALGAAAKEPDAALRLWAAERFEELGPTGAAALPYLTEMLTDAQVAVSTTAASALSKIGGDAAKNALDSFNRKQTVTRIAKFVKDLRSSEASVTSAAVIGLSKIGKPAVSPLILALKDPYAGVRMGAASALGLIGADAASASPSLLEALDDKDPAVRHEAAAALERFNDPRNRRSLQIYSVKEKVRKLSPF